MLVSIGIIAFNEEIYLPNLLNDINNQNYPHEKIEVILVNSLSTDKTLEIMKIFKADNDFYKVSIFDNPKKILSAGWNIASKNFNGDCLIRIDAHASIPNDFISKNVNLILSGEDVVGGQRPNIIDENTPWKKTLLDAETSMFGSGIAPFRNSTKKSYVKSIFHGMYKREVIENVGLFNEKLHRTEDNEFNYRVRKKGYKLCYSDEIISYQHTRSTLSKMLKQKYSNGKWIGLTTAVCRECLSIYHYIPFAFLISLIVATLLIPLSIIPFILVMGSYSLVNLSMSIVSFIKSKFNPFNLLLPIIFFMLHISYGLGTLIGFIQIPSFLKNYRSSNGNC